MRPVRTYQALPLQNMTPVTEPTILASISFILSFVLRTSLLRSLRSCSGNSKGSCPSVLPAAWRGSCRVESPAAYGIAAYSSLSIILHFAGSTRFRAREAQQHLIGGSIWLLVKKWERPGLLAVSGFGLKWEKGSEVATSAVR